MPCSEVREKLFYAVFLESLAVNFILKPCCEIFPQNLDVKSLKKARCELKLSLHKSFINDLNINVH